MSGHNYVRDMFVCPVLDESVTCNPRPICHATINLVWIDFGNSELIYGWEKWDVPIKHPPQGLVQGNGLDPTIWSIMINPIINCLRDTGHGESFKLCLPGYTLKLVGYCFVEDSTIIQVVSSPTYSKEDKLRAAQRGLDIFEGASQSTGGHISVFLSSLF